MGTSALDTDTYTCLFCQVTLETSANCFHLCNSYLRKREVIRISLMLLRMFIVRRSKNSQIVSDC